ncbi:MAG: hypothetical protein J6T10_23010 [Methanobrevibacter sp.]|nr:hypothetical protein [Methanobrevibacter sp.]
MQVFIIKKNGKPIYVGLNTDLTPQEYNKVVQEALHQQELELKEKERLEKRVADLEKAIQEVRHDIKIDRGEE